MAISAADAWEEDNTDDYDNDGIPDVEEELPEGPYYFEEYGIDGEDDLVPITLVIPAAAKPGAHVTISTTDQMRLWQNADRSGIFYCGNGGRESFTWVVGAGPIPQTVYMEGVYVAKHVEDARITLKATDEFANDPPAHPTSTMNSSKPDPVPIAPPPNPGILFPGNKIIHVIDDNIVNGNGHSAVLIPRPNGLMYYSFANGNRVETVLFANPGDAMEILAKHGYTRFQEWTLIEGAQANAADAAAMAFDGQTYNASNNNRWSMVYAALQAAQTDAVQISQPALIPKDQFNQNRDLGTPDGSGPVSSE